MNTFFSQSTAFHAAIHAAIHREAHVIYGIILVLAVKVLLELPRTEIGRDKSENHQVSQYTLVNSQSKLALAAQCHMYRAGCRKGTSYLMWRVRHRSES